MMRSLLLSVALMCLAASAHAQKEFNTWYFGHYFTPPGTLPPSLGWFGYGTIIRLSFDDNGPVSPAGLGDQKSAVVTDAIDIGSGECAGSICDAQGNLLLYSDGSNLYGRNQRLLPGGYRFRDAASPAQLRDIGISILPEGFTFAPGPDGFYYAFYWDWASEGGELAYRPWYALVDMRGNGGYGAVVRKQPLLHTFCPRMAVVRHRNNRDFWFVTRDLDSRGFRAYLLDRRGLNPVPVVSLAGVARYPNFDDLKAAPNGRRLVSGACNRTPTGVMNCVCVYDFDNATGEVSNELLVRQKGSFVHRGGDTGHVTSVLGPCSASFSPDSRLLYSTEANVDFSDRYDLWQYDLTQPTAAAIAASRYWVSNTPRAATSARCRYFIIGGLQLAPDRTLWATHSNNCMDIDPLTGTWYPLASPVIRHPNVVGAGCGFELLGYRYPPGYCPSLAFPNLITNMLYAPPALNHEQGCADDSTQFWASSAGLPAGLRWDFGDPGSGPANTASGSQVAHRYARNGSYPVRLLLADGQVLTQVVTVVAQTADFTGANVFTPNNDGLNDAFVPVRGALPGGRLRVFSRWGIPVFGTDDAEALRWDGAGAAGGEYFYQLDYPDCQGRAQHRRGVITLVR